MNDNIAKGINEVRLQRLRVGNVQSVSRSMLEGMTVKESSDLYGMILDKVLVSFQSWVAAGVHEEEAVELPASWWQHFKRDHFPAWALKRWPVEVVIVAGWVQWGGKERRIPPPLLDKMRADPVLGKWLFENTLASFPE